MGAKLAVSQIDLYALQVFSTREFKILNFGSDKFMNFWGEFLIFEISS